MSDTDTFKPTFPIEPQPTYHLLTPADAEAFRWLRIYALEHNPDAFLADLASEESKSVARFSQEIAFSCLQQPFGYYGCVVAGKLVGYVQISTSGLAKQQHVAFLYNLFFHPEYRGQGLARGLVNHVTEILRQHGCEQIFASCLASNTTAFQFYQKLGFSEYGRRRRSVKWHNQYDDELELVLVV